MPLEGHWWHKLFMEIQWKPWLQWQLQDTLELQWENAYHHHSSFSFDWMFLKLAGVHWTWIQSWTSSKTGQIEKPLFDFVISITHSILIASSCNLLIRRTWMKFLISLKTGQIRPLICLMKKPLFDFVISMTHSVLIRSSWNLEIRWTWIVSTEFKRNGQIGSFSYVPFLLKKPLFVISITCSVLIGSSWNLQIRWTWMKFWMSQPHNSFSFDQIFLNLTYKIKLKLGGQLDYEVIKHIVSRFKFIKFWFYHYVLKIFQTQFHFQITASTIFIHWLKLGG